MTRQLRAPLLATLALIASLGPAVSQTQCDATKKFAAIDAYGTAPFSARSWRKASGLGDPGLEPAGGAWGNYESSEAWKKLVAEIAPDMPDLVNVGYDCRISYPTSVLQERASKLGKTDPYLKQWLKAQAVVLQACAGSDSAALDLPPPLDVKPELADLQSADRAYQQASVAFYREKAKAVELFRAIASSNSPHKAAARYNIANLLANARDVVNARKEADAILADPALSSVHGITKDLLGYIANLEDTADGWTSLIDGTVTEITQPLDAINANEASRQRYANALYDIDFAGVNAKKDDWWITNTLPENPTLSKALADSARKQPMVLWMMTGQTVNAPYSKAPWSLAGAKWQAWSSSFIDRALTLKPAADGIAPLPMSMLKALKTPADDAARASLWQAAKDAAAKTDASCGEAPETAAAVFLAQQASRLSATAGKFDEIYANLPTLKLEGSSSYNVAILLKIAENILATGNAEEGRRFRDKLGLSEMLSKMDSGAAGYSNFATFLTLVAEDEDHWLKANDLLGEKLASPVLNLLPARKLRELAQHSAFSAEQQALLLRAAWTRNYARGIANDAKVTDAMLKANPEIGQELEKTRKDFPKLNAERVLLLTILRNPRFGILLSSPDWTDPIEAKREIFSEIDSYDHNDKNWWCPLETDRQLDVIRARFEDASGVSGPKGYYTKEIQPLLDDGALAKADAARDALLKSHPMVKAVDWKEVQSLSKAPSAPRKLSLAAIKWAKASKGDDGAPEALALAVQATRYGCNWHGGHKAYSKSAQELLKAKFGTTTWAQQTPYWFDCMENRWDDQGNKVSTCEVHKWPKQAPLH